MTPSSVTLSPDPAVAGRLIAVTVPGVTSAPVASGKISVLVSYTGVPVYETSVNLCDTVDCPVAPGEVTVRYNTTLPGVAPPVRPRRCSPRRRELWHGKAAESGRDWARVAQRLSKCPFALPADAIRGAWPGPVRHQVRGC